MREFSFVLVGILVSAVVAFIIYLVQVSIRLRVNKIKIKQVLSQIKGQVDIKRDLVSEYLDKNKKQMSSNEYKEMKAIIDAYLTCNDACELKDYNALYVYYLRKLDDDKINKIVAESEEKIDYIRVYYNDLVYYHNSYKAKRINALLSKVSFIKDEKLY